MRTEIFPTIPLSVIIVHYGSDNRLFDCLEAIRLAGFCACAEVIVVNNNPKQLFLEAYPFAREVFVGKNVGFGSASNRGAQEARGSVLFFLNPDTKMLSGNIPNSIQETFCDQSVHAIGMRLVGKDFQQEAWSFGHQTTLNRVFWKHFLFFVRGARNSVRGFRHVDWVSGGSLAIRKKDFEEIGGFDERFFLYFEDMDLCVRLSQAGKRVCWSDAGSILHIGGASFVSTKDQKKHYYTSQNLYFQKHRPKWEGALLAWMHWVRRRIFGIQ